MKSFLRNQKGLSVVEILIAIGVIAIAGASIAQFISTISSLSIEGERRIVAMNFAQEGITAARSIRNRNYDTLNSYADSTAYHPIISGDQWEFQNGTENINDLYYRQVIMENVCRDDVSGEIDNDNIASEENDDIDCSEAGISTDDGTIKIVSRVTWPVSVSSPRSAGECTPGGVEYTGGCFGPPGSDWPHEVTLVTYLADWR